MVRLRMPKLRAQTFETAIIEHRRRASAVEEALIETYLAGVSVRRVEDITGTRVSPSTVSELNKEIYGTIEAWRNRPIDGEHPYVLSRRHRAQVAKSLRHRIAKQFHQLVAELLGDFAAPFHDLSRSRF